MAKGESKKLYYSISEVAELARVKQHVLRYWEGEFPALSPPKNRAGNRMYRDRDVKLVLAIRELLYEQGYTIAGARQKLSGGKQELLEQAEIPFAKGRRVQSLRRLEEGLKEVLRGLDEMGIEATE
jgi:DNA-binding transcriptional MerR regulator